MTYSKYKFYQIFNYNKKNDSEKYYNYTLGGKNEWFFETIHYYGAKPFSDSFPNRLSALNTANMWECESLIKHYTFKRQRLIDIYYEFEARDKNKLYSKDISIEKEKISDMYIAIIQNITKFDKTIIELRNWKNNLQSS